MRITEDIKVFHLLEEFPESEEVIRKYFAFFYQNRLEDIALKRLSIRGAFNVIDAPDNVREDFFKDLFEKLDITQPKNIIE
ncbi:hypothetical protein [Persephonella sp.]